MGRAAPASQQRSAAGPEPGWEERSGAERSEAEQRQERAAPPALTAELCSEPGRHRAPRPSASSPPGALPAGRAAAPRSRSGRSGTGGAAGHGPAGLKAAAAGRLPFPTPLRASRAGGRGGPAAGHGPLRGGTQDTGSRRGEPPAPRGREAVKSGGERAPRPAEGEPGSPREQPAPLRSALRGYREFPSASRLRSGEDWLLRKTFFLGTRYFLPLLGLREHRGEQLVVFPFAFCS